MGVKESSWANALNSCLAGHENDVMTVAPGGSMPEEVCMPGSMQMDVVTKIT